MAPASKKAKAAAAKPVPGGGLQKFFGSSKNAKPAASSTESSTTEAVQQPALEAAAAPDALSIPSSSAPLTDVQKQRIDENRRKAMERKQAKQTMQEDRRTALTSPTTSNSQGMQSDLQQGERSLSSPESSESKQSLKRKGSDITPEKVSMPEVDRRIMLTPMNEKFHTFGKVSWMQYNSLYLCRLQKLRDYVLNQAMSLWSTEVDAYNFLPTIASSSSQCSGDIVVVGVAFKDMPSRDNVIEQYRDSSVATSCLPEDDVDEQTNLCSNADVVWLEDASFRIQLNLPSEQVEKLATGFVAAVRGKMTNEGKLEVRSICLAQGLSSVALPAPLPANVENLPPGPYVALLSGLLFGAPDEDISARSRALNFLLGQSHAVRHAIVCGGVYWVDKVQDGPSGIQDADAFLSQLSGKLQVDVMPGYKDPSNLSLPQMPLHPYLFPSAQNSNQFKSVSNPYQCSLDDVQILGHSGQPVRDLMRCASFSTPIQALARCLDARLLAPTAPDTLITQPFDKADPFMIEATPRVLFSGCHDDVAYEWRTPADSTSGTLCVCVPAFHKCPVIVLVNLKDPCDVRVQNFRPADS